jgi:hypothetical protein
MGPLGRHLRILAGQACWELGGIATTHRATRLPITARLVREALSRSSKRCLDTGI